jgi:hypothetical protein
MAQARLSARRLSGLIRAWRTTLQAFWRYSLMHQKHQFDVPFDYEVARVVGEHDECLAEEFMALIDHQKKLRLQTRSIDIQPAASSIPGTARLVSCPA